MNTSDPPSSASVQTNITAESGGSVCAPLLLENKIEGSVTVTVNNIYGENSDFPMISPPARETSTSNSSSTSVASPGVPALTKGYINECKEAHKSELKMKYTNIKEAFSTQYETLLNELYTDLYITEGGSGEVNSEHEVRQIETSSRKQTTEDTPIKCNDIFKPSPGQDKVIRTVLTRGVAGIGKTVSVQKFILDWAEGEANQDITLIFPFAFRELNLIKEKKLSLVDLIHLFFPKTKKAKLLDLIDSDSSRVMFIFDGLDECRPSLDLEKEVLSDVTEPASVDVLLTNLIKGNLLSSALLWITSRPAAVSQILLHYVNQVTEIRGFNDPQKEDYFRKRISDQSIAEKIITHMKSSRSLHIMCHIPVFCSIAAAVLEEMLAKAESGEIPKTLTQMFIRFLKFQIKSTSQKCTGKSGIDLGKTRKIILALGKLAFQQLEQDHLIFYEEDLRQCGIDVKDECLCSGVFTQIFRVEYAQDLEKVFSFVHLSIQEFLAALFAFLSFITEHRDVLSKQITVPFVFFKKLQMSDFLSSAVDKALRSENGHLDLFLRFLLGLSLESSQTLLRGLLPKSGNTLHKTEQIVKHIKKRIKINPSPEKSINLFYCLNELNDHSLVQEVQTYLNSRHERCFSGARLSPAQWSALVFVLLNSDEELDEFDLSKYDKTEECLLRLLPVVKESRKVQLDHCLITDDGYAALVKALKSNPANLRELSLNYNKPGESAAKMLSNLLEDPFCKLETLQLMFCHFKDEGCTALFKALKSNPSHLRKLNINYNKPGESGVKELSDLLKDPDCKLETLQLEFCRITEEGCTALFKALKSNPSHLRELNINYNKPGESGVKELSELLTDPDCKLETLQLDQCSITEEGCTALFKALKSNPAYLRKLNLNNNKPGESGVKELSELLTDPDCKLQTLQIDGCSITDEGCIALSKALKLNPSYLRKLSLNNNKPGESGVKELSDLLKDPLCKLKTLQLELCSITEEGCTALFKALKLNPVYLRKLNINYNKPVESGMKELSDLLTDPDCKLETLQLDQCNIAGKCFTALLKALKLNPSHLRNLSLNSSKPGESEVKELHNLLKDPLCKLETLQLKFCSITEKGFTALIKALKLNPSHLRELSLSFSTPGESGVKLLSNLLKDPHCKLEKLQLTDCRITNEGCCALIKALKSNSSLRELDLRETAMWTQGLQRNTRRSALKALSDLRKNPSCKLETAHIGDGPPKPFKVQLPNS